MQRPAKKSSPAGKRKAASAGAARPAKFDSLPKYLLRLYVSGSTSKSTLAVKNIKRFCERNLKNRYGLEVIDIYQQASLARHEKIVVVPTLIKLLPLPLRRLIG